MGGQLAWNIDNKFDFMIYSNDGDIFFNQLKKGSNYLHDFTNPLRFLYIHGTFEFHYGQYISCVGAGLGISTLSFLEKSGGQDIRYLKQKMVNPFGILKKPIIFRNTNANLSINASYKRILHNTMLQGFGTTWTFKHRDGDEPLSNYVLNDDEIERDIISVDLLANLRINKTTFYYKVLYHSREFNKPWGSWYGWGTLGVNYLI